MSGEISNKADWTIQIIATDDETGNAIDFAGASVAVVVKDERDCLTLTATTENGKVTLPSLGVVECKFDLDDMKKLSPATYKIGGVYELNGETNQLFVGEFSVYDGIATL